MAELASAMTLPPAATGAGVATGHRQWQVGHQGDVADGHDPAARIAVGGAVAAELADMQVGGVQAGLLGQLPLRGPVEVFTVFEEPAGQSELAEVGLCGAFDDQDMQSLFTDGQNGQVDRDRAEGHLQPAHSTHSSPSFHP